jgi:hypothetical protein
MHYSKALQYIYITFAMHVIVSCVHPLPFSCDLAVNTFFVTVSKLIDFTKLSPS